MPPFHYEQYRSPYTATLATLVGAPDRAQAQAARSSGESSVAIAGALTNTVTSTLNDLMRYKMDAPRRANVALETELRQQQVEKERTRLADERTLNDLMSGQSRTPVTGGTFDEAGAWTADDQPTPTGAHASREEVLRLLEGNHTAHQLALKQFQASDEDFARVQKSKLELEAAQRRAKDDVTDHLGGLGYAVMQFHGAPLAVQAAIADAEDKYKDDPEMLRQIGVFKARIGDAADKDLNLQAASALANQSVKYRKPPNERTREVRTWGADGTETVRIVSDEPGQVFTSSPKPAALGTVGDYLARYARDELGVNPSDMTPQQVADGNQLYAVSRHIAAVRVGDLTPERRKEMVQTILDYPSTYKDLTDTMKSALLADLATAGFTAFGAPSASTVATAERWRANADAKVDNDLALQIIDQKQADALKARNLASYKTQIGQGSGAPPPRPARVPAPPPAAAPPVAAPAATAPTPEALLKNAKPGKYTLTDHSVWIKGKDGRVTPAPK